MSKGRVWDVPTRLFHWALVVAIVGAFVSEKTGAIELHGRIGLTILGLLVFRLIWGFFGSTYARFRTFVAGPQTILSYLRGEWSGLGHNPLGALSVLALLGTLAVEAGSGLFAGDDIAFTGPLAHLVSDSSGGFLTKIHHAAQTVLIALLIAHLAAIVYYTRVKRKNLLRPMITGWQRADGEHATGGGLAVFFVAVGIACTAVYAASGEDSAPLPAPTAKASPPAW